MAVVNTRLNLICAYAYRDGVCEGLGAREVESLEHHVLVEQLRILLINKSASTYISHIRTTVMTVSLPWVGGVTLRVMCGPVPGGGAGRSFPSFKSSSSLRRRITWKGAKGEEVQCVRPHDLSMPMVRRSHLPTGRRSD